MVSDFEEIVSICLADVKWHEMMIGKVKSDVVELRKKVNKKSSQVGVYTFPFAIYIFVEQPLQHSNFIIFFHFLFI